MFNLTQLHWKCLILCFQDFVWLRLLLLSVYLRKVRKQSLAMWPSSWLQPPSRCFNHRPNCLTAPHWRLWISLWLGSLKQQHTKTDTFRICFCTVVCNSLLIPEGGNACFFPFSPSSWRGQSMGSDAEQPLGAWHTEKNASKTCSQTQGKNCSLMCTGLYCTSRTLLLLTS